MADRIAVWVATSELGGNAFDSWAALRDLVEDEHVEVVGWGANDDDRGNARLLVSANDEPEAVARTCAALAQVFARTLVDTWDVRTRPGPDDPPIGDDDEYEDEDIAEGLHWVRSPIDWDAYDLGEDERMLRIHYTQAGTASGPGAAIAEVVVTEFGSTVAVTLFERDLQGTYPDGAIAGRKMAAVGGCLQVRLSDELGQRRVVDGTSGIEPRRLDPADDGDRRFLEAAARGGCPVWQP